MTSYLNRIPKKPLLYLTLSLIIFVVFDSFILNVLSYCFGIIFIYQVKKEGSNMIWKLALFFFAILVIYQITTLVSNSDKLKEKNNISYKAERINNDKINKSKVYNWYEGGTLHKSLISEWRTSSYKNKLATCGDWMAVVDNTITMNELKTRSESLLICIDEAVALDNNGQQISGNLKVVDIATGCISLLNN